MQFKDVVGQELIKKTLIQEVNEDRLSHAQMFLGKAGYGSLPLAIAFVQYIFCTDKSETDSCGKCASCSKVKKLQHPDLHFSYPSVLSIAKTSDPLMAQWREKIVENPYFSLNNWSNTIDEKGRKATIGTEESANILKKLSLKSFEGGYKVMIIWMSEEMNTSCSNKLLKIIEEPPARTLFILICEDQEKILPTILSRTQLTRIPRLEEDTIIDYLSSNNLANKEGATSIAFRAEGSLIEALDLAGNHEQKDENRDFFIHMMRVCYKKNVLDMMEWADKFAAEGRERQKNFLKYCLYMVRQSMMKNYTDDTLTRTSDEESAFLSKFAQFITGNNAMDFMSLFNDSHYHVDRNVNAKILFTNLSFQVMRLIRNN